MSWFRVLLDMDGPVCAVQWFVEVRGSALGSFLLHRDGTVVGGLSCDIKVSQFNTHSFCVRATRRVASWGFEPSDCETYSGGGAYHFGIYVHPH